MVDRLARMSRPCVATHGCGDSRGTDAWFHPHAPARGLSIASQPALDGMLNERSWVPGLGWVAAGAYRTVVAMLVARASPLLNTLIGSKCVKPTRRPLSTVQGVGATAVHGEPPNTPTAIDADPPVTHVSSVCTGETQTLEARASPPSFLLMLLAVRQDTSRYEAACRIQGAQQLTRAAPNPPLSVGERCDPGLPRPQGWARRVFKDGTEHITVVCTRGELGAPWALRGCAGCVHHLTGDGLSVA
jgi:hypothetical protein